LAYLVTIRIRYIKVSPSEIWNNMCSQKSHIFMQIIMFYMYICFRTNCRYSLNRKFLTPLHWWNIKCTWVKTKLYKLFWRTNSVLYVVWISLYKVFINTNEIKNQYLTISSWKNWLHYLFCNVIIKDFFSTTIIILEKIKYFQKKFDSRHTTTEVSKFL